ncbi:MAG TPA: hypothetical protein VHZ03_47085 [Trebonia sp.]|nr:hypothetical protein [Trebonia sp.]
MVREHLVLVCPACQRHPGWSGELQSCARCGSLHLIRRLDQVECLDCCLVRDADAARDDTAREQAGPGDTAREQAGPGDTGREQAGPGDTGPGDGPVGDAALAAEVASALSRVLHRR